ncbi:hypothetical protein SAMD00019534_074460 [Acytostelium subglobosum LB1]|uniref:hypothetical protein n=1 Tax=Acytostelium subglobosum LB1 TaxID=1410327 RepID=UPI000644CEC7|nr:hypothetical protein SAMD00019534_074460 [Acytostelium subglobosum LB1]GAM24271.1 hypothetical protein SAMD00019534_074460 [Acytostelium subglobosum LB1]|eukprot:XP_012752597.1 hypothetical protein SAMD00019534_074460 [Acytostelium subglobosum LB1]
MNKGVIKLNINVHPNAKQSSVVSVGDDGSIDIRISQPPIDGRANDEVVDFLSDELGVRRRLIQVEKGLKSRNKVVSIDVSEHKELMTMETIIEKLRSKIEL